VVLLAACSSGPGNTASGTGGASGSGGTGTATGAGDAAGSGAGGVGPGDAGHGGTTGGGGGGASGTSGAGGSSGVSGTSGSGAGGRGGVGTAGASGSAGSSAGGISGTGGSSSTGGTGGAGAATLLTVTAPWPNGAILTGVRDVASPAVTQVVTVHNGGSANLMLTALAISGTNQAAFKINGAPQLPAVLAPGGDLPLTIQVMTSGSALPAAPAQDAGGTILTASLTATAGSSSAQANLFGVILTTATHEVTLGQILQTLGYKLNVGMAQNNANPNSGGTAQQLPKVESGTDEIAAPLFKKAATGNVTLLPVARFSPKGPMPFGWYPAGNATTRNPVAEMASMADAQTSDKARMVLPPIAGATTFDPGTGSFGVWVYTDQVSQKYDTGGTASNGDYAYSEDGPNAPANVHRCKVYPLKNGAGVAVAGSYLLAVEEAANGDYQDYVFVLSNVTVAP